MNLVNIIFKVLYLLKGKAFERSTKNPLSAQKKVLFEFIERNKESEYGKKYHFSDIKSIEDYQKLVPVCDYETLRPLVDRMLKGESSILTAEDPTFYSITSGSTGKPKFLPSTDYARAKKSATTRLWLCYINLSHPRTFSKGILGIPSTDKEGRTETGLWYGAESGFGYRTTPKVLQAHYILPYDVLNIKDMEARYYSILRISMEHELTGIFTVNPTTLILLCEKIEKWKDKILEDIEKGTLSNEFEISSDIRKTIEKGLRSNPKRAKKLRSILKEKNQLLPKHFWPDLELIMCWKGGAMEMQLKELKIYFGNVSIRDIGYVPSEARGSVPMTDEGASGVLDVKGNFYEFVPEEEMGKREKRFLLCEQLEKGKEYFIILTTPGGFFRYNIDDKVRVTGFFNKTPIIEFVEKGIQTVSLAGEKLHEEHVNAALCRALERSKVHPIFFTAEPKAEKRPCYAFLAEFHGTPSDEELKNFLKIMEEELCREDREYDYVREAQLLASPVLKILKEGEYEKYRSKKIAEGVPEVNFKIPALVKESDFEKNFVIAKEVPL